MPPNDWNPWSNDKRSLPPDVLAYLNSQLQRNGGQSGPLQFERDGYLYAPVGGPTFQGGDAGAGMVDMPYTGWTRTAADTFGARNDWEQYDAAGDWTDSYIGGTKSGLDRYGWAVPLAAAGLAAAGVIGGGSATGAAATGAGAGAAGAGAAAAPGTVAQLSLADLISSLAPTDLALGAGGAGLEAGTAALAGGAGMATGGAGAAEGLVGGGGTEIASTAQQVAQGGLDSASRAVLNSNAGYGAGMSGAQTGLFDTLSPWLGPQGASTVVNSGAGDLIGRVVSGLGGGATNVLSSLVQSVGPAIAMKVLAGEVPPPTADPALAAAIQGQLDLARSAESRATANDDYWKSTFAPRLLANMDTATALSKELQTFELGRAKRLDDRYWNTTARFQDQFYKDVDAYNSDAERERIAGEAIGDVRRGFSTARAIAGRDLARMGINPGSGRYAGQLKQLALDEALAGAAAGTQSRRAAEDKGLGLKMTAAGMNANLPGAAGAAAAGAGNAAGVASQGIGTASNAWGANNSSFNQTMGIASGAYQALGGIGSSLTRDAWQASRDNTVQRNQIIGAGLGMLNWGR